jgi:hypothetical protein
MGLAMPGSALLFLLFEYANTTKLAPGLTTRLANRSAFDVAVVVLIAYMLGYALQAISYLHFRLFDEIGWRLMGKSISGRPSDHGISAASKFTGRYFEKTAFYKLAKAKIVEAAKLTNSDELGFSDVQNLAFSIAGPAADKASVFQFRADICGALATLSLIMALTLIPLLRAQGTPIPGLWWLVEIGTVLWLFVAVSIRLIDLSINAKIYKLETGEPKRCGGKDASQERRIEKLRGWEKSIHAGFQYLWWAIPLCTVACALILRLRYMYLPYWWTLPLLFFTWFAFLYRAFFYTDIRGRIIFHIAIGEIWRSSLGPPSES